MSRAGLQSLAGFYGALILSEYDNTGPDSRMRLSYAEVRWEVMPLRRM